MYLEIRKRDWKNKIPKNALVDGEYIGEADKFIKDVGAEKVLDLILNRYVFVWQHQSISHVRLQLTKEVGYWRKANAIHNWFVKNVQNGKDDCGYYAVTKNQLNELSKICEVVYNSLDDNDMSTIEDEYGYKMEVYNNVDLAEKLLPTTSGFFFGGTEYTKDYKEDLLATINICEDCDFISDDMEILYHSSW